VIFVTVGTNEARFDRLLRAVAELELDEEVVVQHGHSSPIHPAGASLIDFLPFEGIVDMVRRSRVVVTHAGVGSVMVSLANGKRPIVVPRRKAFAEAVDDHQLELGRRFASAGLVTFIEAPDGIAAAVRREQEAASFVPRTSPLALDLRGFLEEVVAAPRSASLPA
jgi:UDP-N-acetylglucosamine transferase subunit ALG13